MRLLVNRQCEDDWMEHSGRIVGVVAVGERLIG